MSKQVRFVLPLILALTLALSSCRNFPLAGPGPELSSEDIARVFAAQTAAAIPVATVAAPAADIPVVEQLPAPAAVVNPTACSPIVTAIANANVRNGPGTDYGVVGNLPIGGTAPVAGRNDASTWWYIQFGGTYAWIAASVVDASCLPAVLPVVAGPPLPPTSTPTLVRLLPLQPLLKFRSPTPTPVLLHQLQKQPWLLFPSPTTAP